MACSAIVGGLWPACFIAQSQDAATVATQQKARVALAATIQTLGGPAWLSVRTSRDQVRIASFFQGNPTGEIANAVVIRELPDKERIELDKGQVVQIFSGSSGWEITYRGKRNLPEEQVQDRVRWQKYSLRAVLGRWYRDPAITILDEGPVQVDRHQAEKFTLMNTAGEMVTLQIDAQNHLPLRLTFDWRDPRFHDKNVDAVEYDNYHRVDGVATPFTVTRTHNGETVAQQFVLRAEFNVTLQENLFDPDYAAAHLK